MSLWTMSIDLEMTNKKHEGLGNLQALIHQWFGISRNLAISSESWSNLENHLYAYQILMNPLEFILSRLNKEMIDTLFGRKTTMATKGIAGCPLDPSLAQESRILDPNKSQKISNLLKDFNLMKENVSEAILEGKADSLGKNVLEALKEMIPSRDEEIKLKQYKEKPPLNLGPAESFLKSVISILYAFKRVVALLYISNFDSEVNYLNDLFRTLKIKEVEQASKNYQQKVRELENQLNGERTTKKDCKVPKASSGSFKIEASFTKNHQSVVTLRT
ncbi:formin-like protein 15 isoform X2 [Zingiber officinale]|nr:formin-like protein 15 isoform X2 [Zingiber officinale]